MAALVLVISTTAGYETNKQTPDCLFAVILNDWMFVFHDGRLIFGQLMIHWYKFVKLVKDLHVSMCVWFPRGPVVTGFMLSFI